MHGASLFIGCAVVRSRSFAVDDSMTHERDFGDVLKPEKRTQTSELGNQLRFLKIDFKSIKGVCDVLNQLVIRLMCFDVRDTC